MGFGAAELREIPSLCHVFQRTVAESGDAVALRTPDDAVSLTWRRYGERVRRLAAGLHALGVRRGDTVALMLANRPEFHLLDVAAFHLGAIPFSIYNTSSAEQIEYLFANAGNRIVVCEERFLPLVGKVDRVVCVDGAPEGTISLAELENTETPGFDFDSAWQAVGPGDVLTLIYTSGTTGPPKGVELTHRNLTYSMGAALESPDIAAAVEGGRVLSFLPDAHLANRYFAHYFPIVSAATITCVADPKAVVAALPAVRPTVFLGVPMLWYKIKAGIEQAVAAQPGVRRAIAEWALGTGLSTVHAQAAGAPLSRWSRLRHRVARRLVLDRLLVRMGLDACVLPISGAAPIAVDALNFLMATGLPICEGWAMSETSVHGTINPRHAIRPGTVGKAQYGAELRLADDGELLMRSPALMRGYRHDPGRTAEAIDEDGWLHTGDIATIDADGYVSIVDRKKELIINAAGKNMSPSNIENTLKSASALIGSAVAIGDRRPCVVALITLDPDAAAAFAERHGLPADPAVLAGNPVLRGEIADVVERANARLSRVEQVKEFTVLPVHWEPGGTELTPTMKLKRASIAETYAAEIDALYRTPS
ncbi:AMP-dependent synthetase [Amycolatopsis orientalis]|uniref:Acyl-CoA synthetase n=1 Tax=Amycolatopsis orientalis TaxID=31958 RepID=A0A193BVF6_AMYOR|nr:AMP-dependent synthetase/ligase [Amycolatopsis orientalis]ANN16160.1 AMP-dependent synthetase [Amycolatopsis orientalis]